MDVQLQVLVDIYKHPINYGRLENPDVSQDGGNPLCGDEVHIELKFENGKILEAKFEGRGCIISIASTSLLTDALIGMTKEDLKNFSRDDLLALLGIPISPTRIKCALLGLETTKLGVLGESFLDED